MPRIAIMVDNATWHNELMDATKPPRRSWRKEQRLDDHSIKYDKDFKKAELLDTAFSHISQKRYKANASVMVYKVELVRLSIKHCGLNPIQLTRGQLKANVRSHDTSFRLSDVRGFAEEYTAALDDNTWRRFIELARVVELTFRKAYAFVESRVKPDLVNSHVESDFDPDNSEDDDDDSFQQKNVFR